MMGTVLLDSLVPIFAVMGLGYLAGRIRDIDNKNVAELNALVVDFALPAFLLVTTATTPRSLITELWPMLLVLAVVMLAFYAISFWMQRRLFGLDSRAASVQAITVAQPNYAATGLPLITAVFHHTHVVYVALALVVGSILTSPLTLAILDGGPPLRAVGRSLLKPIVLAPILGIGFALLAVPLPGFIAESFTLIGQSSGGVAAFVTGLILSAQPVSLNANIVSGMLLKNVAQPLLAAGLIALLPARPQEAHATILLAALPAGFFGVLFGLRYGVETHLAGSTLVASSLFSVVTLAIGLALLGG
jgi:malonate transporter and related proteins